MQNRHELMKKINKYVRIDLILLIGEQQRITDTRTVLVPDGMCGMSGMCDVMWRCCGVVVVVVVVGICVNIPPRMCDGGVLEVVLLLLWWWASV